MPMLESRYYCICSWHTCMQWKNGQCRNIPYQEHYQRMILNIQNWQMKKQPSLRYFRFPFHQFPTKESPTLKQLKYHDIQLIKRDDKTKWVIQIDKYMRLNLCPNYTFWCKTHYQRKIATFIGRWTAISENCNETYQKHNHHFNSKHNQQTFHIHNQLRFNQSKNIH